MSVILTDELMNHLGEFFVSNNYYEKYRIPFNVFTEAVIDAMESGEYWTEELPLSEEIRNFKSTQKLD